MAAERLVRPSMGLTPSAPTSWPMSKASAVLLVLPQPSSYPDERGRTMCRLPRQHGSFSCCGYHRVDWRPTGPGPRVFHARCCRAILDVLATWPHSMWRSGALATGQSRLDHACELIMKTEAGVLVSVRGASIRTSQ